MQDDQEEVCDHVKPQSLSLESNPSKDLTSIVIKPTYSVQEMAAHLSAQTKNYQPRVQRHFISKEDGERKMYRVILRKEAKSSAQLPGFVLLLDE